MVSLQGYHEPNDLSYKYTPNPIRKNITHLNTNPESVLGLLQDNSDFSIFCELISFNILNLIFSNTIIITFASVIIGIVMSTFIILGIGIYYYFAVYNRINSNNLIQDDELINMYELDYDNEDDEHDDEDDYVYESSACFNCHPNGTEDDDDDLFRSPFKQKSDFMKKFPIYIPK